MPCLEGQYLCPLPSVPLALSWEVLTDHSGGAWPWASLCPPGWAPQTLLSWLSLCQLWAWEAGLRGGEGKVGLERGWASSPFLSLECYKALAQDFHLLGQKPHPPLISKALAPRLSQMLTCPFKWLAVHLSPT